MRVRSLTVMLLTVASAAACGGGDSSPTPPKSANKTVDVFTIGQAFSPTFATVSPGDTVRWNFSPAADGLGHNVRFTPVIPGTPADVNVLKSGTATRVFTTKGDFKYVCDVHPGMQGDVIVQ